MYQVTFLTEQEYNRRCNNYDGLCLACGRWKLGDTEPDATGYECPTCKAKMVCGAEEAMLIGAIDLV